MGRDIQTIDTGNRKARGNGSGDLASSLSGRFEWPPDFDQVLAEPWASAPVDPAGERYAAMASHRWYSNLELTREQLAKALRAGDLLVDYSGGTGILARQVLDQIPGVGVLIVDASPRFLRVALEQLRREPRVAFRLLHFLSDHQRLQRLDEAVGAPLLMRGVDAIVSTNAVHLYTDLENTFRAWWRTLRPGGRVFIQSGEIRNPDGRPGEWLISDVMDQVREVARRIAAEDRRYEPYRSVLADSERMGRYDALYRKVFLPVRSVREYQEALTSAGFSLSSIDTRSIEVGALEWYQASSVYPDLLAWVGGSPKVDGHPPSPAAMKDRLDLLKQAFLTVFRGKEVFSGTWTYFTAQR
jgi:SAM-dependent methyltransferase